MAGILKVGGIQHPTSGTITVSNGALTGHNYPAFHVTSNVGQSVAQDTTSKVQYNTKIFDTDNCYDTSNYRFTPNVAGKYFVHAVLRYDTSTDWQSSQIFVYKNGSEFLGLVRPQEHFTALDIQAVVECNGSSDFIEIYVLKESASSHTITNASNKNLFYGYRIGE